MNSVVFEFQDRVIDVENHLIKVRFVSWGDLNMLLEYRYNVVRAEGDFNKTHVYFAINPDCKGKESRMNWYPGKMIDDFKLADGESLSFHIQAGLREYDSQRKNLLGL